MKAFLIAVIKRILKVLPGGQRLKLKVFVLRQFWGLKKSGAKLGITVTPTVTQVILSRGRQSIILSKKQMVFGFDVIVAFGDYFKDYAAEQRDGFEVIDFSQPKEHFLNFLNASLWISSWTEGSWPLVGYLEKYRPKTGDIVFDCGAFCGVTAYAFSKLVGETGRVYAFEPDDLNYKMLVKNVEKHNLKNVVAVKQGLYSQKGHFLFASTGQAGSSFIWDTDKNNLKELSREKSGADRHFKQIEVVSLQDACESLHISKPDFVKMDIEGAELDVIAGAKDFLIGKNIRFAIASYHKVNGEPTYKALEKMFIEIGYRAQTGFPRHLTTWASQDLA